MVAILAIEKACPQRADRRRAPNGVRLERVLLCQCVGPFAQRPAQPLRERDSEAHLGALDKSIRHVARKHAPQQMFGARRAHVQFRRLAPNPLNNAMIEQGNSNLQRHGHGGAVDLGEDVVGQIGQHVEIAHAIHRIGQKLPQIRGSTAHCAFRRHPS